MRLDPQEQLDQEQLRRRTPRLGAPAGIFLLDGDFHVAPFESRAADRLQALGALLVAALRFDPLAARALSGGSREDARGLRLQPVRAPGALSRLGVSPRRN